MAGLKSQPEFESQDETATETATKEKTVTQEAPTVDKAAIAAGLAAATAIAKAATGTAVGEAKAPIKYRKAFEEKDNAIPIEDVEQWQLAAPAVTAEQGKAKHSKKGPIGDKFHLRVDHLVDADEVGTHHVPADVFEGEMQVVVGAQLLLQQVGHRTSVLSGHSGNGEF